MAEEFDHISHITNVHIEGYKSIENLDVDLLPGLNILIGKNGSGKSNFLEVLGKILYPDYELNLKSGRILWDTKNKKRVEWIVELQDASLEKYDVSGLKLNNYREILKIDNVRIYDSKHSYDDMIRLKLGGQINKRFFPNHLPIILSDERFLPPSIVKVLFSLPYESGCLDSYGSFQYTESGIQRPLTWLMEVYKIPSSLMWASRATKEEVLNILALDPTKKNYLRKYSPIEDVRFNNNLNVYKEDKRVRIEGIKLEFKINKKWIPWEWLSDGSKRLFYLISSVCDVSKGIFLIEEPEVGIHPHQFFDIMTFLKEESQTKQIIISTHSPEALNILKPDELDRILITSYTTKSGTKMKRLTKAHQKKAAEYMQEVASLSDYWMHSDLEK